MILPSIRIDTSRMTRDAWNRFPKRLSMRWLRTDTRSEPSRCVSMNGLPPGLTRLEVRRLAHKGSAAHARVFCVLRNAYKTDSFGGYSQPPLRSCVRKHPILAPLLLSSVANVNRASAAKCEKSTMKRYGPLTPKVTARETRQDPTCPYCREPAPRTAATHACPGCAVRLHATCHRELQRCPTLGCGYALANSPVGKHGVTPTGWPMNTATLKICGLVGLAIVATCVHHQLGFAWANGPSLTFVIILIALFAALQQET